MTRKNLKPNLTRAANVALIAVSAVLLLLPTIDTLLHVDHATAFNEKRLPAKFPQLLQGLKGAQQYTRGLEAYFNDHFGFRHQLIYWHRNWQMAVFKTGSTKEVVIGKDGWLYYSQTGVSAASHSRTPSLLSERELSDYKVFLERRRDWLAERGSCYLFVVAPDKETIYPEHLPSWLKPLVVQTKLDQLIAYLGRNSTVTVLDLRPPLREAKRIAPTYYKTDTHWNDFGAFVGCEEIIKVLSRQIPRLNALSLDSFDLKREPVKGGDLVDMLGVFASDENVKLSPHPQMPKLVENIRNPDFVRPIYFTSNPQGEGCAVVFRDSFGAAMKTFLGYHFGKVGYYWTVSGFEPEIVEENRPTVVITEIVERNFNNGDLLKSPQPVVAN